VHWVAEISSSPWKIGQVWPGRFEAEAPLDPSPGETARFRVLPESLPAGFREAADLERALHFSYPDEYRFLPADMESLGALAAATGGTVGPSAEDVLAAQGDRVVRARALWPVLALLGLLAYLLDLSVRRTPWIWTRLGRRLARRVQPRPA